MKVVVTGHTSGIGKAIFDFFKDQGHDCVGFSRRTGHDISKEEDRLAIAEQSKDCDIFVNNAYNDFDNSQLEMLKLINDGQRTIFNISSRVTDLKENIPAGMKLYRITKMLQDDYCRDRPNIINLKLGRVDTPRIETVVGKKMSTEDVITIVQFILDNKNKFSIFSLSVAPPK